MIRFALGCTRVVFLTECWAIKIFRPRPLRCAFRFLQSLVRGSIRRDLHKYDVNLAKGGMRYVFAGIVANRAEAHLYKLYGQGDYPLAPTIASLCGGVINVQVRGDSAICEDVRRSSWWSLLVDTPLEEEVLHPWQFCNIGGVTYLADYGLEELEYYLDPQTQSQA